MIQFPLEAMQGQTWQHIRHSANDLRSILKDIHTSYHGFGMNPGLWPSTTAILMDMAARSIRARKAFVCPMFCFYNAACFIWKPKEITHDALYPPDQPATP